MKQRKFDLTCLFLIGWLSYSLAQNPHPYFRNYTTDDGLPSSEVHYCLQDDEGYMWFATDNGVSRFDGYSFTNYGIREGLKDPVVFYLQKDSKGRIWMATMSGGLFYFDNGKILAYPNNDKIMDYARKKNVINDFYISEADVGYLGIYSIGILKVSLDGGMELMEAQNDLGAHIGIKINNYWIASNTLPQKEHQLLARREMYFKNSWLNPLELYCNNNIIKIDSIRKGLFSASHWIRNFEKNKTIFFSESKLYQLEDDKVTWEKIFPYIVQNKAIEQSPLGILMGMTKGEGLKLYRNLPALKKNVYQQFLKGKSISDIYKDKNGGHWISTVENGIYYSPDLEQRIVDESSGLASNYVSALAFKNDTELFIGLRNGIVQLLNLETDEISTLPSTPSPYNRIIYALIYEEQQQILWAATGLIRYFKNDSWHLIYRNNPYNDIGYIGGKRIFKQQNSRSIWGSTIDSFNKINSEKQEESFVSYNIGIRERILVVWEDATNRVWVGNTRGLFEFKNNELIPVLPDYIPFQNRVEDIAEFPDGTLVIATKGEGVVLWDGAHIQQYTTANGLSTNIIENVHVDSVGQIWVGTLEGLNKMTPTDTTYSIKSYTVWHGLPSNEITQVCSRGEQVWVATTKGLIQWKEPAPRLQSPVPILERCLVNRINFSVDSFPILSYQQNNLEFQYVTINYKIKGKIPYRFRLNDKEWTNTQNRSVNFATLAAGQYQFEVQAQNEDGIWSPSTIHTFQISPPFWQTNWFLLLSFLLVGIMIYAFIQWRIQQVKQQTGLAKQMTDLQQAALRAQVNPHFIFNCLNSIQNFISNNDTLNANRYLSRFATLVRGILKASMNDKIRLEEDLLIMENYLELEQLRFKNKFQFNLKVDPKLDRFGILVPPLIIQPFVENAIKHGMAGKKEKGIIEVAYQMNKQQLEITIRDNGTGIYAGQRKNSAKTGLLKSVGIEITQKRLEINGWQSAIIEETTDDNGIVNGTLVKLNLPI